ncbi:MAG TPA: OsmC family protein [Candidatus Bathyarchaeia archaeon]|nr:OsmC family protein [Candidatus Bathyarchaeia archaeon]
MLTVRLYAERKGWVLDRIETRLTRDPGEGKINSIEMEVLLGGDLSDEQRQRLLEIAGRCPVHRTLTEGVAITHRSA